MISFKVHPINGIGPVLEPISACDVEFEWLTLAEKNKNSRMDENDEEDCDSYDSDSTSETGDHENRGVALKISQGGQSPKKIPNTLRISTLFQFSRFSWGAGGMLLRPCMRKLQNKIINMS